MVNAMIPIPFSPFPTPPRTHSRSWTAAFCQGIERVSDAHDAWTNADAPEACACTSRTSTPNGLDQQDARLGRPASSASPFQGHPWVREEDEAPGVAEAPLWWWSPKTEDGPPLHSRSLYWTIPLPPDDSPFVSEGNNEAATAEKTSTESLNLPEVETSTSPPLLTRKHDRPPISEASSTRTTPFFPSAKTDDSFATAFSRETISSRAVASSSKRARRPSTITPQNDWERETWIARRKASPSHAENVPESTAAARPTAFRLSRRQHERHERHIDFQTRSSSASRPSLTSSSLYNQNTIVDRHSTRSLLSRHDSERRPPCS
ncbi:hypothetical protein LshimejAT787_1105400 [Lyophyllum shimeji]|uniref:Uncharacterized protein n=1 Tax=Lyophyllum shimeji TaxID=47721 RepID=A0A9P3PTG1_LYOSH|nr:hypothetical protein LshimejAT787_1105400 [Lyophyllum shimeji]